MPRTDKVKIAHANREYYSANKERLAIYRREYRSRPEVVAATRVMESTVHRKSEQSRRNAERYQKNSESLKARHAVWVDQNRATVNAHSRTRYATEPFYRLRILLRNRLNLAINNKAAKGSAVKMLGCSIQEAVRHLERRFLAGMTWANWGSWHIDHIRPLASFNLADPQQLMEACHYSNLQPLWKADNLRKGDTYKAESAGRWAIPVNPRGTSIRCSQCGADVRKTLVDRRHVCACGTSLDRDHNAALNILSLGKSGAGLAPSEYVQLTHNSQQSKTRKK